MMSARFAPLRVVVAATRIGDRVRIGRLLGLSEDFALVGVVGDGSAVVRLVTRTRPDLVLVDAGLPAVAGVAPTHAILTTSPATTVVMLTTPDTHDAGCVAVRAGAATCVPLDAPEVTLMRVVRSVMYWAIVDLEASRHRSVEPPPWWRALSDAR